LKFAAETTPLRLILSFLSLVGEDELTGLSRDEVADRVLSLEHVWLDEERINHIDNLEMLGVGVTHLYLHR